MRGLERGVYFFLVFCFWGIVSVRVVEDGEGVVLSF